MGAVRRAVTVGMLLLVALAGCGGTPKHDPVRPGPVTVLVSLRDDATTAQQGAVRQKLRAAPGVTRVVYESREQAYQRFRRQFAHDPHVGTTRPEDFPNTFRVTVRDRTSADRLVPSVRRLPGVATASITPTASPTR
ncbi:MAG TPA: permease-like cell division protein FtsX [Actinocatenispora sp.]